MAVGAVERRSDTGRGIAPDRPFQVPFVRRIATTGALSDSARASDCGVRGARHARVPTASAVEAVRGARPARGRCAQTHRKV